MFRFNKNMEYAPISPMEKSRITAAAPFNPESRYLGKKDGFRGKHRCGFNIRERLMEAEKVGGLLPTV